jgi:hypothetical protein
LKERAVKVLRWQVAVVHVSSNVKALKDLPEHDRKIRRRGCNCQKMMRAARMTEAAVAGALGAAMASEGRRVR